MKAIMLALIFIALVKCAHFLEQIADNTQCEVDDASIHMEM